MSHLSDTFERAASALDEARWMNPAEAGAFLDQIETDLIDSPLRDWFLIRRARLENMEEKVA